MGVYLNLAVSPGGMVMLTGGSVISALTRTRSVVLDSIIAKLPSSSICKGEWRLETKLRAITLHPI